MIWPNNNPNTPVEDHPKNHSNTFTLNTPNQITQPSPFLNTNRLRFNSFNSFVSPMRLIQSPVINDMSDFFQYQLKPTQKLQKFKLDESQISEDKIQCIENDKQSSDQDDSEIKQQNLSYKNLIQTIVNNLGINEKEIQKKKKQLNSLNDPLLLSIFDTLIKKFKKLKKTKQQMTKYCIRKAFRYMTQKVKLQKGIKDSQNCLNHYFSAYQNDKSFTIPFRKNSVDKTMNSSFLSKIFSCPLFVKDYKQYIKLFKDQAQKDNYKKINALANIIDKSFATKSLKKIQSFRRLPWTSIILEKTYQLAYGFLQYAKIQPKQQNPKVSIAQISKQDFPKPRIQQKINQIPSKKKSIILLTPPLGPISNPQIDLKKLDDLSKCYL